MNFRIILNATGIILFSAYLALRPSYRNILPDPNIWKSHEWQIVRNPFDRSSVWISRYGGSEMRFSIQNSRSITMRVGSSNYAFDQGITVSVGSHLYELETPDISAKTLHIDIDNKDVSRRLPVIIRHHCAGSTHPCDLSVKSIAVDPGAYVAPPDVVPGQTIAFLGDSISVGFAQENYTYLVADRLDMHLHNASVFGSRTGFAKGWDSALNRYAKDIVSFSPDIVIVALGTNDLSDRTDVSVFREEYDKIIYGIKSGLPDSEILVLGIFRRGQAPMSRIREFSEAIRATAKKHAVAYVDPYNWLSDDDLLDFVHPRKEAQQKIADRLVPIVREITAKAN